MSGSGGGPKGLLTGPPNPAWQFPYVVTSTTNGMP